MKLYFALYVQLYKYHIKDVYIFKDVYNRNLNPIDVPGNQIWMQVMSQMPSPYPELAKKMYITSSWEELDNMTKHDVLEKECRCIKLPCLGHKTVMCA